MDTPAPHQKLFEQLRGDFLFSFEDYVKRLIDVGYCLEKAIDIVTLYSENNDLESLENYILLKESLGAIY